MCPVKLADVKNMFSHWSGQVAKSGGMAGLTGPTMRLLTTGCSDKDASTGLPVLVPVKYSAMMLMDDDRGTVPVLVRVHVRAYFGTNKRAMWRLHPLLHGYGTGYDKAKRRPPLTRPADSTARVDFLAPSTPFHNVYPVAILWW
jgi:hypothetical protein